MTPGAIAAIKDRISLASLVGEYVELRKAGPDLVGKCCFHNEKTASLHVHPQYAKCFGCGWAGDVIDFYAAIESVSKGKAIRALAERCGVTLDGPAPTKLQRHLEKQERAFSEWWRTHTLRERGLRLTLMLEGSLWGDRWTTSMQATALAYGERLRVIREAKGVELRALASAATDRERQAWKDDLDDAEYWTHMIVASLVVAAN